MKVRHLDDFVHQLERERIIQQDQIDSRWGWVFREVLREQQIGYSADSSEVFDLPKTTDLGPRAEAKFKEMVKWAQEQGSRVEVAILAPKIKNIFL